MLTRFIEATNTKAGGFNYGKFMVARFSKEEWQRISWVRDEKSPMPSRSLLLDRGWTPQHVLVVDLQTGEGSIFRPGGYAKADLDKHRVWVCPLFEPFLIWLYQRDLSDLDKLPSSIAINDSASAMSGYRRPGPAEAAD